MRFPRPKGVQQEPRQLKVQVSRGSGADAGLCKRGFEFHIIWQLLCCPFLASNRKGVQDQIP